MLLRVRASHPKQKSGVARPASRGRGRGRTRGAAGASIVRQELPTERKYVTLLRVDLHRSTDLVVSLELEDAIDRLAPALAAMRAAVHAHNGIIHREMGDGLFAAFGAPIAEDLHAVMGCLAALDVLRRIQAIGDPRLQVRIGVHSGQVVAGPRRLDLSTTYEFDGPAMIMADRLQSVAQPGQILASSACRTLAEGYIRFGSVLEHTLKGFPQPVKVHVVESVGELSKWRVHASRASSSFIGRASEMDRLLVLADATESQGRGTRLAVTGQPGVGKSRLVRELLGKLRTRDWQVIEAECSPIVGQSPFALLRAVLGDITEAIGPLATNEVEVRLSVAERTALRILLGHDAAIPPEWAALTPRARNRAIVAATRALATHRTRDRPCVCLIEDLQWADEASVAAMQAVLALGESHPLLALATARSGELPEWFDGKAPRTLALGPLPRDAGLELLDHLLGRAAPLDALKQRILQHTGAMPLFVEEVCRGLVESGTLTGRWGEFETTSPVAELGVPLTVQGVIASRVDRLAQAEKRVLQVASAIGPRGETSLLQGLAKIPREVFQSALAALFGAAMLVPGTDEANWSSYAFPHELVRQVAYDAILASERSALHARILADLEQSSAGGYGSPEVAGALVHHALMSSQWARAADYATTIARRSFAQSALPDAMRHYETAMQAVDRLPPSAGREARAVDLRIEARSAYANIGKVRRWLELAKEAEARAAASGDKARRVTALAVQAAALNFCGTAAEAVTAGQQAVSEARGADNAGWLAYAHYGLGQAYYIAGRYREAIEVLASAQREFLAESAMPPMGGSSLQAGLLCCMMSVLCHVALGNDEAAAAAQLTAEEVASKEGRPLGAIAAALSRGALLLGKDQPRQAEAALSGALTLARQQDINLFVPIVACHQGLALLLMGQTKSAAEAFDLAHTEAEALGHFSAGFRAQIYKSLCDATAADARAAALATLRAIERNVKQQGYEPLELESMVARATILRATNDGDGAARCEAEAASIAERSGAIGALRSARRVAGLLEATRA